MITIQKVVSRNFIMDFVTKIQNLFGKNLTQYEKMIAKGIKQIQDELDNKEINVFWYRYEITQLTNGAIAIVFYGDRVKEKSNDSITIYGDEK